MRTQERQAEERARIGRRRHGLAAAFRFAWDGLAEGAVRDRNLRIHLALGVLAGAFAAHAPVSPGSRALIVLCVAAVVGAEALNTALEAVVDLASPGWDDRARVAKDAAAGAVLAVAAGSVLAFLAIAVPVAGALAADARALAVPGAGALVAALAAGLLPRPSRRARAADLLLGAAGVAGLAAIALGAEGVAGVAASALCLAVAAGAAAKRRR